MRRCHNDMAQHINDGEYHHSIHEWFVCVQSNLHW
jgi:hypothetical protein